MGGDAAVMNTTGSSSDADDGGNKTNVGVALSVSTQTVMEAAKFYADAFLRTGTKIHKRILHEMVKCLSFDTSRRFTRILPVAAKQLPACVTMEEEEINPGNKNHFAWFTKLNS